MDYDDNDFQSQKLAGEGSNKFPPVLRPYALPKFDFDDNLHVPLRFDSLVETEVFLGIESNEDSQWIEDFSRGSGGIQFSSSAAESCSIPLRNNVWSEATSSESVEMLLKSVGQEELILAQTRTKESDACDELGCIIRQMEPNLKQTSNIASRVDDMTNLQAALLPVQFPEKSGLDDDGGAHPSHEDISHSGGNTSGDQGLGNLTAISVEVRLPIPGRSPFIDRCNGNDTNEIKVDIAVNKSSVNKIRESSASRTEGDDLVATVQNIIQGNDVMVNKNASDHLIETGSGTDKDKHHEKGDVTEGAEIHVHFPHAEINENGALNLENPLRLSPMESVEEKIASETNLCSLGEPFVIHKGDFGSGRCNQSSADAREASLVVIEGDSTDHRHGIEDSNGPNLDEAIVTEAVPSILSKEDDKESDDKADEKFNSYGAVNCSLSELSGETKSEDHVTSSMVVEDIQMCEKDVSGQQDITDADIYVSIEQKRSMELSSVDADVDGINYGSVSTSSFGEGSKVEQMVSKSESDSAAAPESANFISVSSGNGITKDSVYEEKIEVPPLSTALTCPDTEKKIAAEYSVEASLSDLKATPQKITGTDLESKKGFAVAAEQMVGKSDNQFAVDACNAGNQIDSYAVVIGEVSKEWVKDKEANSPMCDSTADMRGSVEEQVKEKGNDEKEHVNVSDKTVDVLMPGSVPSTMLESLHNNDHKIQKEEVVIPSEDIRFEQTIVPSTNVEHEGSADLDNPASGSPTVIRSAQSSYDEMNKEGTNIIMNQSGSVSADKVQSTSTYLNKTDPPKDDGSFSFEVSPLAVSPRKNSKKRHASSVKTSKATPIVDASTSSVLGQLDAKVDRDISRGSPKVSDVAVVLSGSKSNIESKIRRASGKASAKERSKKKNSARESGSAKSDGDKITDVSLSPSSVSQHGQSNEIQVIGNVDSNILKPFVLATSTAGLPDLNSSVSLAAIFQQPFTDLQQVQLRAQIFVYGALIQGTAPDEAYMISAFGGPDGGRSMWENSWCLCMERLHGHKSHLITPETPLQSRSGAKSPETSIKHSAVQSKVVSSPIGRGSNKGTPAIVSPVVPFSSPLWSISTPAGTLQTNSMPRGPVLDYHRPLTPLHAHQTPGVRNFVGHSPSWLSQTTHGTPWVASPQHSTLDTSDRFTMQLPVTETVQLTTVEETSLHHSAAMKPTGPPVQNAGSTSLFAGISPMLSTKMVTASGSQPSTDPKPTRRKKNSISDNTTQKVLPSQTESVIASVVSSSLPTSARFATPICFVTEGAAEKLVTSMIPMPADFLKADQTSEHKAILLEETLGKVKDAKVQAEDAAASAASAVSHSQQVWDGLEKQKIAGLLPDAETKLASAAVAIAAAAAVAKAAAAAAKVASNAALQAKLMAEEAVASTNLSQINVVSFPDGMKNWGKATPASILKGDDGTNGSSSVIVAVKEAARKKVKAASAAAQQAENMDAIVKAAEIAAEVVSQAGIIVAMGDPMPLSELVEAGPEGYWKAVTPKLISRSNDTDRENKNVNSGKEGPNTLMMQLKEVPSERKGNHIASHGNLPAPGEKFCEDPETLIEHMPGSSITTAKEARVQRGRKASDLAKTIGVGPESENSSGSSIIPNEPEKEETSKENNIKEHSLVEVYKDGDGFKAAWFPAKVMSLKDEKAFVEYTELALGEGLEKLKEWVPLNGDGDHAPKIRIARPANILPFEGTRKRRRAAMVGHVWSIGDRVDAWIEDSWREGVVTEKNKRDESLLTVNFPARGEILVIPATLLHPSCVWKDGAWFEWSSSGENSRRSHGGDTPKEKRPRVRSPVAEGKGKDKAEKSADAVGSDKSDNPTLLALSADENLFNIGKSGRDEQRTDTLRMPRTGLQKEGSRVIFGVPKPGKKRKFMEVSKHYVADRSGQTSEAKDPLKFTKNLMPRGPGSRAWKSSKSETNEKQAAISKPKNLKSGRPHNFSGRTVPQKGDLSNVAISVSESSAVSKDSANQDENNLEKQNSMAFQPFSASVGAGEGPITFSTSASQSDAVSSKRMPSTNPKPQRVSKGRLAPAAARLRKIEEGKTSNGNPASSTFNAAEPRRSNRRIQPTSRLLEGIQSSLMVSKIPFVSHDKSHKSKTSSRGNNQG